MQVYAFIALSILQCLPVCTGMLKLKGPNITDHLMDVIGKDADTMAQIIQKQLSASVWKDYTTPPPGTLIYSPQDLQKGIQFENDQEENQQKHTGVVPNGKGYPHELCPVDCYAISFYYDCCGEGRSGMWHHQKSCATALLVLNGTQAYPADCTKWGDHILHAPPANPLPHAMHVVVHQPPSNQTNADARKYMDEAFTLAKAQTDRFIQDILSGKKPLTASLDVLKFNAPTISPSSVVLKTGVS